MANEGPVIQAVVPDYNQDQLTLMVMVRPSIKSQWDWVIQMARRISRVLPGVVVQEVQDDTYDLGIRRGKYNPEGQKKPWSATTADSLNEGIASLPRRPFIWVDSDTPNSVYPFTVPVLCDAPVSDYDCAVVSRIVGVRRAVNAGGLYPLYRDEMMFVLLEQPVDGDTLRAQIQDVLAFDAF